MTGLDKDIFRATRALTTLLNEACNHWNCLCPYLEKLAGVANEALLGYQKEFPEEVSSIIEEDRAALFREKGEKMKIKKIREHYEHAKQKHPYFCDCMNPQFLTPEQIKFVINDALHSIREHIERGSEVGSLEWDNLLNCEVWEIHEAYANGDTDAAIEECYDAIAVLLRVIDVLEGHQELGNPNKQSEMNNEK